ncbi:MAG TPA: hypothetical protein VH141_16270 [Pseudonocardia sp.]|jgi:hypothetical protein|nr:hypothetical protein [Pseudonocardia sp.]
MPESPVASAPPRWLALRWLLVTVTGAGVIAMHTLMGTGVAHHMTGAEPMAGAVSMAGAGAMTSAVDAVGAALMTDPAPTADRAPITAAPPAPGQDAAGHQGHHGDGSMSMLAHLCLAVLGLLLLVLAAPALLARYRRDTDRAVPMAAGHPPGYGRSRAPPPTAVRLAELCISRR